MHYIDRQGKEHSGGLQHTQIYRTYAHVPSGTPGK